MADAIVRGRDARGERYAAPAGGGAEVAVAGAAAQPEAADHVDALLDRRTRLVTPFLAGVAERVARLCHRMARRFERGGRLLAVGASPADRSDVRHVAVEFVHPVIVGRRALPSLGVTAEGGALDLTEDVAVLPALADDVGPDVLVARQVIAHGRPGDVVLAFSTSGASRNVIAARREARRRGPATIALVGYDGGRIRAEGLADHAIVSPSQSVPRTQGAQATACHLLRELVERR